MDGVEVVLDLLRDFWMVREAAREMGLTKVDVMVDDCLVGWMNVRIERRDGNCFSLLLVVGRRQLLIHTGPCYPNDFRVSLAMN